jgi:hypothetical protein
MGSARDTGHQPGALVQNATASSRSETASTSRRDGTPDALKRVRKGKRGEMRRKAAAGADIPALALTRPTEPPRAGPTRVWWQPACTSIAHGRHRKSEPSGRCVVSDNRAAMAAGDRARHGLVRRPRRGAGARDRLRPRDADRMDGGPRARPMAARVRVHLQRHTGRASRGPAPGRGTGPFRADHRFADRARGRLHRALGPHVLLLKGCGRSGSLLGHDRRGSRDR